MTARELRFVKVPREVFTREDIGFPAMLALCAIEYLGSVSTKRLAKLLTWEPRNAQNAIRQLLGTGDVEVDDTDTGDGRERRYRCRKLLTGSGKEVTSISAKEVTPTGPEYRKEVTELGATSYADPSVTPLSEEVEEGEEGEGEEGAGTPPPPPALRLTGAPAQRVAARTSTRAPGDVAAAAFRSSVTAMNGKGDAGARLHPAVMVELEALGREIAGPDAADLDVDRQVVEMVGAWVERQFMKAQVGRDPYLHPPACLKDLAEAAAGRARWMPGLAKGGPAAPSRFPRRKPETDNDRARAAAARGERP